MFGVCIACSMTEKITKDRKSAHSSLLGHSTVYTNFRAHGLRRYTLFADTLHTCSIHIRNVKYKGQQLFCHDISII